MFDLRSGVLLSATHSPAVLPCVRTGETTMAEEPIPPAGLHPDLVKRLLDNLESNDDFRTTFQADPEKALRALGYQDPWACMQFNAEHELPSPEDIKQQREKLEGTLTTAMAMYVFKI
jgi:putative modified peptide